MSSSDGYVKLPSEPRPLQRTRSSRLDDALKVFDELPKATVVSVSRPDAGDISPVLLTYTIEFQYKQFKWQLLKKPSQVFYLHFALKKRAIIEEFHEKQEQVKEWLQNLGMGDHATAAHDDDEVDDDTGPLSCEESNSIRKRNIPSSAAFPVIRPSLGGQRSDSGRAKAAMQGYLNHFLGNLDVVNTREVCKFLEVSNLSFLAEYGPKLKEGYLMVKHLTNIAKSDDRCCLFNWFSCCNGSWKKVWATLKPGFIALLEDPFKTKPLDVILFDVLPYPNGNRDLCVSLAKETKGRNPLRYGFKVSCGNRTIKLRLTTYGKVKGWITAINDTGLRPSEGWCYPHRYGSFAPSRGLTEDGSMVQWFIDGKAAFEAIAVAIEEAKSEIFITGWWLCPELYLHRPFHAHSSSRLDTLLEAKAKQGVQIYILLYKEVALALKINSMYSKRRLLDIHENVKVLRHPDHLSMGIYLWSHHEKIVVIDYKVCFLGGLDLCFGRYDTPEHKISDYPPLIWPGKDYYNPRESEPNSWVDTMKDELDRQKYPRMPWHDVQCALWGPPCRDVARHFIQRWNHAKRSKASHKQEIPLLLPQQHMVLPHYFSKSKEMNVKNDEICANEKDAKRQAEISRSLSYQDIPLLLPQEADGHSIPCINSGINGFTNSDNVLSNPNAIGRALSLPLEWLKVAHTPERKELVDDLSTRQYPDEACIDNMENVDWWESQERTDQVSFDDEAGQAGPRTSCRCQVIRSVGEWSAGTCQMEDSIHKAYVSLIENAEHFIYIENQILISGISGDDIIKNRILDALYRRIMRAYKQNKCFRVVVVIPLLPGFQGGLDDFGAATVRALVHWQYRTISRGPNSILQKLSDAMGAEVHDYISFYGLRAHGKLSAENHLTTNQVYVHSKLMIVDDRMALIGSANINDRSLLGSRDSEIGVVIEDKDFVESSMNGEKWNAGKFAFSLRLSLWCEHLGLSDTEISTIIDPVEDASYKNIWIATAKANTEIYHDVFNCIPNDSVTSRVAIRQTISCWKERVGHTTIDMGIAPKKLLGSHLNEDITEIDPLERLKSVKGHLTCFPLEFMSQEDLRPVFNETEFYAAPQVFH